MNAVQERVTTAPAPLRPARGSIRSPRNSLGWPKGIIDT